MELRALVVIPAPSFEKGMSLGNSFNTFSGICFIEHKLNGAAYFCSQIMRESSSRWI
jgi:hypothetical protein